MATPSTPSLRRSLRKTFGLDRLRPGQATVIRSVLAGRHTLAIMPTGAGKSLCYQLPALHLDGTTIVVSPLIALMKDQVDKLRDLGLEAGQVNSAVSEKERAETVERVRSAESEFVFTTPERLTDPEFLRSLRRAAIDFVVIDEAHCISQWGHDFRPSYLALGQALRELGSPPVLALTATATREVADDIQRQLGLEMEVHNAGIFRPNLAFSVERVTGDEQKLAELARLLDEQDGAGMVYAATVRHVEAVADALARDGREVERYHGKLAARRRREAQDRFMRGAARTMIATNAFGLGIDKPDIRFVVHYDMPGSLEAYYQEAGRAGRDDEPARCVLLFDPQDRRTQLFFLGGKYPRTEEVAAVHGALRAVGADANPVRLTDLQARLGGGRGARTRVVLALLKDAGVVRERRGARYALVRQDLGGDELEAIATRARERGEADRRKVAQVEEYGTSVRCRWRLLLDHFDEGDAPDRCGTCDNCLHPPAERIRIPEELAGTPPAPRAAPPSFTPGDRVVLPQHGEGEVVGVEGETLLVRLSNGEERRFLRDFARPARTTGG